LTGTLIYPRLKSGFESLIIFLTREAIVLYMFIALNDLLLATGAFLPEINDQYQLPVIDRSGQ
jgi:hypothetical protein